MMINVFKSQHITFLHPWLRPKFKSVSHASIPHPVPPADRPESDPLW